jgi:two-component system OmpR family sensor kinase
MRRSIVGRLTAWAGLWAVTIAVTLGGVALWQYRRMSLRVLDATLVSDAEALARTVVVQNGLLEVDVPAADRAALSDGARYYAVEDPDGRLLDGDPPPIAPGPPRGTGVITHQGFREARIAAPNGGLVRVGHPLAPVHTDLWRLAASLVVASLVTLPLALPLMVRLRRTLAQSLTQFDRTAQELAPGRPARIDPARVDDELVGVARRLNEAFDRLEAGIRRERQLTADASHELRTPVSTILAETEWALGRERPDDDYRHALDVCRRQGRRLKDLVETLLALARIESGEVPPVRERLELQSLVEAAIGEVSAWAGTRNIRIHRDGEAAIDGDRVQIGILLSNLLSNAVRYNRDGGEVHVRISQSGPSDVRLSVRDTGRGFDSRQAERAFDRFWRGDPARASGEGGSGLGLAISKAVVDAHDGSIRCETSEAGTTFVVELPAAKACPGTA